MRTRALTVIFFLLAWPAWCNDTWFIQRFLPPDSLSFEEVRAIVEAEDGTMWFASDGRGVARLSGSDWKVFDEEAGLPSNHAYALANDGNSGVWVGTQNGIAHVTDNQVATYAPAALPTLRSYRFEAAARLRDGTIWFGSAFGEILAFAPAQDPGLPGTWRVAYCADPRGSRQTTAIRQLGTGAVWVAQAYEGLLCDADGTWKSTPIAKLPNIARVLSVAPDASGGVWIAGEGSPAYWDGRVWRDESAKPDILTIAVAPDGSVVAGTASSGVCLRDEKGNWRTIEAEPAFGTPLVRSLAFSRSGRGWIGTKEGIAALGRRVWRDASPSKDHSRSRRHAFLAAPDCPPLAVNDRNELVAFDESLLALPSEHLKISFERGWHVRALLPTPVEDYVALLKAPERRLWLMDNAMAYEFSLDSNAVTRRVLLPRDFHIEKGLCTKGGVVCVGGKGGAFSLQDGAWKPIVPPNPNTTLRSLEQTPDGALLVCTVDYEGSYVEVRDPAGEHAVRRRFTFPKRDDISGAFPARDGRIWITTTGSGLMYVDIGRSEPVTVRPALQGMHYSAAYEAADGTMWFGNNERGISSHREDRWISYSHEEGLPSDYAQAFGEYPRGVIWVAMPWKRLYCYRPGNDPPNTRIAASPREVSPGASAVLSFGGSDMWTVTPSSALVYSWRLLKESGRRKEVFGWSPYTDTTTLVLPQLDSGDYAFEVRAADKDRQTDPTPAVATFSVLPPLRARMAFLIPVSLSLALALGFAVVGVFKHMALRRSQREVSKLASAVEQAAEVMLITNEQGVIQYVNPVFERLTGYARHEAIGRTPRILKSGRHDDTFYGHLWRTISRGEPWSGHITNRTKGGDLYETETSISPLRDGLGAIVSYVAVQRDITAEIRLENQLRQSQKMEAVGQLAGGIAHDFNNLLQAIIGYTQLVADRLPEDDVRGRNLQQVLRAAEQAAALTRQLLAFSRREMLQRRVINFNQTIADTGKMIRRLIGEHIEFTTVLGPNLWNTYADPAQFGQVLVNLCVNARDAMPEGGKLVIETRNIVLDAQFCREYPWGREGDFVMFMVSDTGTGMSPDVQEHVFEPFFTTKEVGHGTGLGLATVYGIIKQHGGFITLYSEVGVGTTFKIYLPATRDQDSPVAQPEAEPPMTADANATLLIAEDEAVVREFALEVLSDAGYKVLAAPDGVSALDLFLEHEDEVDLVLLDVVMPRMSGKTLYERIREVNARMPAVFSSGYSLSVLDAKYIEEVGARFLQKPYRSNELRRTVFDMLSTRRRS